MKIILLTGMSGSGKSLAIDVFEEFGYYVVDNLPPLLIERFISLVKSSNKIKKIVIASDTRGGEFFNEFLHTIKTIKTKYKDAKVVFLDADNDVLVRRYNETRRKHPVNGKSILSSIKKERSLLEEIKVLSDQIVDTSRTNGRDLKRRIKDSFITKTKQTMQINILSFGFKNGMPLQADYVFDCRFVDNPFYVKELKKLTGRNIKVRNYVFKSKVAKDFLDNVHKLIIKNVDAYIHEDKYSLTVAFGCTGGQHRSVSMAIELYNRLKSSKVKATISHRDS